MFDLYAVFRKRVYCKQNFKYLKYSQTSVVEHNSFWKAVPKPICSKIESLEITKRRLICSVHQKNTVKPRFSKVSEFEQFGFRTN